MRIANLLCEKCPFKKKGGYNENKNINWKSWWTFVRRKDDALQPVKILVRDETSKVETRKPQRWFGPSFNCHHQKGIPPHQIIWKKRKKRKRNNIVHRGYIYTVHTVYKYIYILKVKLRWPLFLLSLLPPPYLIGSPPVGKRRFPVSLFFIYFFKNEEKKLFLFSHSLSLFISFSPPPQSSPFVSCSPPSFFFLQRLELSSLSPFFLR